MDRPILDRSSRSQFKSLLDASVLNARDDSQVAITFVQAGNPDVQVTRRDFREQAKRMGRAMQDHGIGPGDVVIIAHTQDLEGIYLFWGAMLVGAVPSIFHTVTEKIPAEVYYADIPPLIEHSRARAVYTTDEYVKEIAALVDCPVYGSSDLTEVRDSHMKDYHPDPETIAFLQHSSGTTGTKKGVALSHAAVLNQIASYSQVLRISDRDTVVSWMPLYHDGGLIAGHLIPLVQGIPLVLMSPFDWIKHPGMLFRAISNHQGTLTWLPNFAYNHCVHRVRDRDLAGVSLSTMRAFINAAEPVRTRSHEMFLERFGTYGLSRGNLTVMYGMAENVLAITQTPPGTPARVDTVDKWSLEVDRLAKTSDPSSEQSTSIVSCGSPLPYVEIMIVNDEFEALPERRVGEIAVRSDCLFEGYYLRPDLTKKTFRDGWHLTGDLGYLVSGELYVTGRKKDLIIHAGKNIYPHDLETIAGEVPGVHPGRVVCFGVMDEREGTELVVIVAESDSEFANDRQRIGQTIRETIARQTTVTPTYVEVVDRKWMSKTSSGKISRAANRAKWLESHGRTYLS